MSAQNFSDPPCGVEKFQTLIFYIQKFKKFQTPAPNLSEKKIPVPMLPEFSPGKISDPHIFSRKKFKAPYFDHKKIENLKIFRTPIIFP